MSDVTLYGFAPSTYVQTARLAAAEVGARYALAPLEFKQASHFALHPYGKMPVLAHGETTVFETLAIVTYLDQVFGNSKLQPKRPAERARMMQWVSVAVDYAYEDLVDRLHADKPDAKAVTAAGEQLALLDGALADSVFFAGATLSVADLFLYPMINFALAKLGDDAPAGLPNLKRWRTQMGARASVREVSAGE